MTLSVYTRPEFQGKTMAEIKQVMRRIYTTHRLPTIIAVGVQLFVMFGLFRLYLAFCQADFVTGLSLAVSSAVLGGSCSWLLLVNVVYPRLIRKEIHG